MENFNGIREFYGYGKGKKLHLVAELGEEEGHKPYGFYSATFYQGYEPSIFQLIIHKSSLQDFKQIQNHSDIHLE